MPTETRTTSEPGSTSYQLPVKHDAGGEEAAEEPAGLGGGEGKRDRGMRAGPRRIRDDEEGGAGTGGGEGGCGKAEAEAADKSKRPPAPSSASAIEGREEGRTKDEAEGRSRTACRGGRCSLRPTIIMRCVPCRPLCFQHVPLLFPPPNDSGQPQDPSLGS